MNPLLPTGSEIVQSASGAFKADGRMFEDVHLYDCAYLGNAEVRKRRATHVDTMALGIDALPGNDSSHMTNGYHMLTGCL